MCNLFIVYYKFFILHIAKAYLGTFQTSMMEFFSGKIYRRYDCSYIVMTAWKHYFIIKEMSALWKNTVNILI